MNSIILFILGIAVAPVFSGFPTFEGRCPTPNVDFIQNFTQREFSGFWYIIERYEEDEIQSCSRFTYQWDENSREFNQVRLQKGPTPEGSIIEYHHSIIYEKEKLSNNGKFGHQSSIGLTDYQFVDTDYDTYAVLWTCLQIIGGHEQNLIVMARDKFFDINSSESLNATLAKAPFNRNLLRKIDHTLKYCEDV